MRPCCIEEIVFVTEHQLQELTFSPNKWRPRKGEINADAQLRFTSDLTPVKTQNKVNIDKFVSPTKTCNKSVRRVRFQLPSPDGDTNVIVGDRGGAGVSFHESPPTVIGKAGDARLQTVRRNNLSDSRGRDHSKIRSNKHFHNSNLVRTNSWNSKTNGCWNKSGNNCNWYSKRYSNGWKSKLNSSGTNNNQTRISYNRVNATVSVTSSPGYRHRSYPTGTYKGGTLSPTANASPHHAASPLGGVTLLQAARDGDDKVLKELLRKAILIGIMEEDLNAADSSGRTALSYITSNGPLEILELILQLPGLNINKPDNEGNTPLHFAAQAGQIECLNCLLNRCQGVEIDARNNLGFTPLMKAALQGRNKCAKLLLLAKANPTLRDNGRGFRADEWARFCGRYICADVIEKYAKQRLLEKTTSSGNWGRENKIGSRVMMGKVVPIPQVNPPTSNGLKSKLKRVFRTSSDNNSRQEDSSYSSAKLVTHLTSAALCASSPILPSAPTVPPVVKSLIRPLTVPKLQITLANNGDGPNSNLYNGIVTKVAPHAVPEDLPPTNKPTRVKKKK